MSVALRAKSHIAVALLALAGCGGGGGGSTDAPTTPAPRGWGQRDPSYGSEGISARVDMAGHFAYKRFAFGLDGNTYILPNDYVVKLDPRGALVPSYGMNGRSDLPVRYSDARSPVVDGEGNVYVPMGLGAIKLRADGMPAARFGIQGVAFAASPQWEGEPWMQSLAIDSAGALYAAGSEYVARFDSAGRLDPSYAINGMHALVLGTGAISDIQIDARGNAYLGGSTSAQGAVVIKLDATGFLATDFGAGGVWSAGCRGIVESIALMTSGVAAGVNCTGETDPARRTAFVYKLDPQGKTVVDYRDRGTRPLFGVTYGYVQKLDSLPGGEVFASGFRTGGPDGPPGCGSIGAVLKLDERGETIPAFDASPMVLLEGAYATDMGIDAAGSLYVATTRLNSCVTRPPAGSIGTVYKLSGS